MSLLNVLHFPDPRLRTRAEPVEAVDDDVRRLVDDMFETMYAAPGIGLAATQVNVHRRVIVIDVSEGKDQPLCLINPEITALQGIEEMEEGCLSVPGVYERVSRADRITASRPSASRLYGAPSRSSAMARRTASTPRACWRFASSTRWTISRVSSSSITSPR